MVRIDPEFKSLIPPLAAAEFSQLQENIASEGCRDSLVLWESTLIDGHNRYEICSRLGLHFSTVSMDFATREEAKLWILRNQLGRRNLTDFQRTEIALKMKPLIEVKAREKMLSGENQYSSPRQNSDEGTAPLRTDSTVAELAGVSRDTVRKVEKIQQQAAPEIVEATRSGGMSIHLASQVAELPGEEQEIVTRAILEQSTPKEIKEVALETVKRAHVANSSGNNEWYTPSEYIELARAVMGSIDTDPASSAIANETVRANQFFTVTDDGLSREWSGSVWLNPPYGKSTIERFCNAVADKYESGEITQACVLVNNATETSWFQRLASCASAMCFPRGRIQFIVEDGESKKGSPLQGQAFVYLGRNVDSFKDLFRSRGFVVVNE
jgi:phage N-6-adenine-methyltransferase